MAAKKSAKKAPAKKKAAKKAPAKKAPATKKLTAVKARFSKTQILTELAESNDLTRKQVSSIIDDLSDIIERHVKKGACGEFVLPGLLKVNTVKKPAKKAPAAPFTTSTLQQEASRKLYFSVSKTMTMAQRLYESGLITYMRTDSVNLSDEARNGAKKEIESSFGSKYSKPRNYTGKSKGAQEAHEAIRPTDFSLHSVDIDRDQARLYDLIWKRAIASQMSEAELERTNVKISASTHKDQFTAYGEVITFDGFLKVYLEGSDDEDVEQEGMLPAMKTNEALHNNYITATERYTRPPYRYTEASLVKQLEELGIGRPSTYAPTISTIQNRNYVEKGSVEGIERNYTQFTLKKGHLKEKVLTEKYGSDKGKLVPTDIGMIVTDFLVTHFEHILDYNFTAKVEEGFDDIAEGKEDWTKMMKNFYKEFHPQVEHVQENADRESGERILGSDPKTGKQVSVRLGKFGPMVQIGTVDDDEKPQFASLSPDQQLNTITYEEAMDLFQLPKSLGAYKGEELEVNNGRFGPYVKYGSKFVSLPKGVDALSVELEDAIELIKEKEEADAGSQTEEIVSLVCRRRDCEYRVVAVMPEAEEHAALEDRLASLLWSGGES